MTTFDLASEINCGIKFNAENIDAKQTAARINAAQEAWDNGERFAFNGEDVTMAMLFGNAKRAGDTEEEKAAAIATVEKALIKIIIDDWFQKMDRETALALANSLMNLPMGSSAIKIYDTELNGYMIVNRWNSLHKEDEQIYYNMDALYGL